MFKSALTGALPLLLLAAAPQAAGDPSAPEATAPEAAAIADRPAVLDYETEVGRLESDAGALDPLLGEQLLGLGLVYQQQHDHENAVAALTRALQIRRVNEGLEAMSQVPILESLIRSNIAAENWKALDRNYHLLLWVNRRNLDEADPELLPYIDRVGRWKVKAYSEQLLDEPPLTTLHEADRLYDQTIRILEDRRGEHHPDLVDPLYGRALVGYQLLIETLKAPVEYFQGVGGRGVSYSQVCRQRCVRIGQCEVVCQRVTLPDTDFYIQKNLEKEFAVRQSFLPIGAALKQIVEIHEAHPEIPAEQRAAAHAHLGDWYLLSGKRAYAMSNYKSAWRIMEEGGVGQSTIDALFGGPRTVPTLGMPVAAAGDQASEQAVEPSAPGGAAPYVKLALDVTSTGKARNVQVIEQSNPDDEVARRKARVKVEESTFRPRILNGEPVDTVGYEVTVSVD